MEGRHKDREAQHLALHRTALRIMSQIPGLALKAWCRKSSSTSAHMQKQFLEGACKLPISPSCCSLKDCCLDLESEDVLQSLAGAQCPGLWKDRQFTSFSCAASCQQSWKLQIAFWVTCVDQINGVRCRETWPQEVFFLSTGSCKLPAEALRNV